VPLVDPPEGFDPLAGNAQAHWDAFNPWARQTEISGAATPLPAPAGSNPSVHWTESDGPPEPGGMLSPLPPDRTPTGQIIDPRPQPETPPSAIVRGGSPDDVFDAEPQSGERSQTIVSNASPRSTP
jgi:hypothetical protein